MIETFALLIGGLIALLIGGELLVRGAVRLAEKAGVTPLVVGLVIVGFGTSTPELMTSVEAAMAGSPAIAWGNIVGSNIVNVLVILGVAVLITPIVLRGGNLLRDTGVCAVASLGLLVLGATGWHGAWIGLAMVVALVVYIVRCYRDERVRAADSGHTAAFDRQQALEIADMLVRSNAVDVIIVDSVAALTPKAEIEGEMGDSHVGLQARLMSQALRKLTGNVKHANCLMVFINQIRMKIGVMFGSPKYLLKKVYECMNGRYSGLQMAA